MGYWINDNKKNPRVRQYLISIIQSNKYYDFLLITYKGVRKTVAKLGIFTQVRFVSLYCSYSLLSSLFPSPPGLFSPRVSLTGTHQGHQPITAYFFLFLVGQRSYGQSAPTRGTAPFPGASQPCSQLWFYYRAVVGSQEVLRSPTLIVAFIVRLAESLNLPAAVFPMLLWPNGR